MLKVLCKVDLTFILGAEAPDCPFLEACKLPRVVGLRHQKGDDGQQDQQEPRPRAGERVARIVLEVVHVGVTATRVHY